MKLNGLLAAVQQSSIFRELITRIQAEQAVLDQAILRSARPYVVAALSQALKRPILIVTGGTDRAYNLTQQLPVWLPEAALSRFAEPKPAFYERIAWSEETLRARLETLALLMNWESDSAPPIVVTSAQALMQKTLPLREFKLGSRKLRVGQQYNPDKLMRLWLDLGYEQSAIVSQVGHFSRRGGIIDVFPPTEASPIRIEFFDDEIESLRRFDPASQRSLGQIDFFVFSPTREAIPKAAAQAAHKLSFAEPADVEAMQTGANFPLLEFYIPWLYPQAASLLDYLPPSTLVLIDDWAALRDSIADQEEQALERRAEKIAQNLIPPDMPPPYHTWDDLYDHLMELKPIHLGRSQTPTADEVLGNLFQPNPHFGGQLRPFLEHLAKLKNEPAIVISRQNDHLNSIWAERHGRQGIVEHIPSLDALGRVNFVQGELGEGWQFGDKQERWHIYTDTEIFGWQRPEPRRQQKPRYTTPEVIFADLDVGDYVVHIEHGIGRFAGLIRRTIKGEERELLQIAYAENDVLFVPIHQADRLTRYVNADDSPPNLTRLGTQEWVKTRQKASQAVEDIAEELLALYAAREMAQGHAFSPDTPWQHELEASFPFVETEDQLKAIRAVKADMEAPQPMDRLICGDVGYGKTEIAIRAAFKAIMDGKQVAILAPTTILANQHYHTFSERLQAFPAKVEMISRFRTPQQQNEIIRKLAQGQIDILIGTHRLLANDIDFKDLGLVVIDEEQRFGMTHKEHLKKMRTNVDVLTLTATPIPRTLYTGITGIRDISIINTAPEERLPVATHVGMFDERLVRQAIIRELERGGQIYFVHNRIQSIDGVVERLQNLIPHAKIAVGHSQMTTHQLENTMRTFALGKVDILVSTSIIESGLDIPNANTIIIDRADWFGLADLYQLRGRVGRSAAQGYAYFFHPASSRITEEARIRLETIAEETQLGAGLAVAMRDLELRGAGDLLGKRQSGHIAAVGFHLYTQLLTQAVQRLRKKQKNHSLAEANEGIRPPLILDLPTAAYLPAEYIDEISLRIQLYRRLADLQSESAIEEMRHELFDRFGALPPAVEGLLYQLRVKVLAIPTHATAIIQDQDKIGIRLPYLSKLDRLQLQNYLGEDAKVSREAVWISRDTLWQSTLLDMLKKLHNALEMVVEPAASGL